MDPSFPAIRSSQLVPRGEEWKEGVCRRLGWPVDTPAAWKRILASVD
ncbi:DUF3097 family protein, partial [Streptomyces sp. BE20]